MDAAERHLLETTVLRAIETAAPHGNGAIDDALTGLGWLEMLETERSDTIDIVFRALGSTNGSASALDDIIVSALGVEPRGDLAVLLPTFGAWCPPGNLDGERVVAVGLASARCTTAAEMLVVCSTGDQLATVNVPASAADASVVRGLDPNAGLHIVRVARDGASSTPLERPRWDAAVADGQRAVAHQLAGACRAMLELAREHALQRVQFGRPIVRFQAVRHRLADALVSIEALEATLTAASNAPSPLTAALAKATAGRTTSVVGGHCQQVLAGIGFTTDHPFHRLLKRTLTVA
jgi:hypothetical protein